MAMTSDDSRHLDAPRDVPITAPFRCAARAYCGPAHGRSWTVDADVELQAVVWLGGVGAEDVAYSVAFDPVTGRPARDRLGNVVYMPVREDFPTFTEAAPPRSTRLRAQAL